MSIETTPIPVYLYMGMLEGGKTSAINSDLKAGHFAGMGKGLLLQCEDGLEGPDEEALRQQGICRRLILDPTEYTRTRLQELCSECTPDFIIFEAQGIWPLRVTLREMPKSWFVKSAAMCADATSFLMQYRAMDRLTAEKIHIAGNVFFHSANSADKTELERIIKLHSSRAVIRYI